MKALVALMLLVFAVAANAQPRSFSQGELDALLAPVALQPDGLLNDVLVAATYPDDVYEAAAWLRANPHLKGDEAVRAAAPMLWHPSLKALLAFPELIERMAESPQWTEDLGAAFLAQQAQVMATVQSLRLRAQGTGHYLPPAYPAVQSQVVFVRYYDPLVVFGPWRHSHRPIHIHRPVHVHRPVHRHKPAHIHNRIERVPNPRPIIEGARFRFEQPRGIQREQRTGHRPPQHSRQHRGRDR